MSPSADEGAPQERVLILAPQGRDGLLTRDALARAGVAATPCSSAQALVDAAGPGVGAVLLTAEALSAQAIEVLNGFVRAQESWSDLSFILLVGKDAQGRTAPTLFEARCNLTVLSRPLGIATLATVVQTALRARRRQYEVRELLRQRERLNERLEQRSAELEAANRELETFSYSVSHDLRAPLRSVSGYSALLLEDASQSEQARHYLKRIHANALRMSELIDDLLRLASIAQRPLHKREVDLAALAREVSRALAEHYPGRTVAFEALECPPAYGDERLLSIVMENLLSNAWKFTARTPRPEVRLGSRLSAGETVYFVSDNGAGFDMAYAGKLFGPFQRLHSDADFSGTGIGLATVQRIIRKHGGRVWAEAEPGEGATFFFTLESAPGDPAS